MGREVYPALDAGSPSQPVPNLFRESQSDEGRASPEVSGYSELVSGSPSQPVPNLFRESQSEVDGARSFRISHPEYSGLTRNSGKSLIKSPTQLES